jgi:hypothetical protein
MDANYRFMPFEVTAEVEAADLRGMWGVTFKVEGGF